MLDSLCAPLHFFKDDSDPSHSSCRQSGWTCFGFCEPESTFHGVHHSENSTKPHSKAWHTDAKTRGSPEHEINSCRAHALAGHTHQQSPGQRPHAVEQVAKEMTVRDMHEVSELQENFNAGLISEAERDRRLAQVSKLVVDKPKTSQHHPIKNSQSPPSTSMGGKSHSIFAGIHSWPHRQGQHGSTEEHHTEAKSDAVRNPMHHGEGHGSFRFHLPHLHGGQQHHAHSEHWSSAMHRYRRCCLTLLSVLLGFSLARYAIVCR